MFRTLISAAFVTLLVPACDPGVTPEPESSPLYSVELRGVTDGAAGSVVSVEIASEADFDLRGLAIGFTRVDAAGEVVGGGLLPVSQVIAAGEVVTLELDLPDVHLQAGEALALDQVSADEAEFRGLVECQSWCDSCDDRATARCPNGVQQFGCECEPNKCSFTCAQRPQKV